MNRVHLDANVILRFLRNDHPGQSKAAEGLFRKATEGHVLLFVSAVTVGEVFYAFTSFYKLSPQVAAEKLLEFARTGIARFDQESLVVAALQNVIETKVDFGDAYLAATASRDNDYVASFDRDFAKFKSVKLYKLL